MATIITATALDRYRASLKRVEILDAETERELAEQWADGNEAAGVRLIESSLPFVIAIAREIGVGEFLWRTWSSRATSVS